MMQLLLRLSGIESNPGPTKYPCGECNNPVRYGRSIVCDICNKWYHKSCIEMRTIPCVLFSFFVINTQDKYVPSKMSSVRYS